MHLFALDPGYEQSALVELQGHQLGRKLLVPNAELLDWLAAEGRWWTSLQRDLPLLVIEQVESYGLVVGRETFETCHVAGRFHQAWTHWGGKVDRMPRRIVKLALCGTPRATDAHIRQALIDRFGPSKQQAIGLKASPGPLFGVRKDEWQALALGVAYQEQHQSVRQEQAR